MYLNTNKKKIKNNFYCQLYTMSLLVGEKIYFPLLLTCVVLQRSVVFTDLYLRHFYVICRGCRKSI